MEKFDAIPVFVEVVKNRSFSAAAQVLDVSKSAVSKRITQLENQLGVRLLYRTTRKLSLTEAGERYFELASKAVDAAIQAEDAVMELQGEPQGRLRVSCSMSFGLLQVAPLIPKFIQRYPNIQIDLILDDRNMDLVAESIDVAIRSGTLSDSSLVARRLSPLRQVLCASPEYIKKHGEPSDPAELEQRNCILFSYSIDTNEWTLIREDQSYTVTVSGNFRVNNSIALLESLVEGIGIGRLPSFIAGSALKSGKLVQVLADYRIPDHTFYAVYPERAYLPAKVRAFINFAIEYFGGDNPHWDAGLFTK